MARSIRGQVALVTGSARRVGRAIALALSQEGASILVHYDRSEAPARELCDVLSAQGVKAWPLRAPFENAADLEALVDRAVATAGRLDILVNNASVFPQERLEDVALPSMMRSLEVNAWAPLVLSRAFHRKVGHGSIVNLLDTRVTGYDWAHVGYILSKHVLAVLTRMTALQFAPDITVNTVAPGLILPPPGRDEAYLESLSGTVPLRRHGTAEDVADAVRYLTTASFLTGCVIFVDGGRHLMEPLSGPNSH